MCEPFLQLTFRIFRFKSYNAYWTCTYTFIILKTNFLVFIYKQKKKTICTWRRFFQQQSQVITDTDNKLKLKYTLNFENLQGRRFLCYSPPPGHFFKLMQRIWGKKLVSECWFFKQGGGIFSSLWKNICPLKSVSFFLDNEQKVFYRPKRK